LNFCNEKCDGIDECVSKTCNRNGKCVDGFNDYKCLCEDGFTGKNCETNIDDCHGRTCSGVGKCKDGVNEYTCQCRDGYSGKDCEKTWMCYWPRNNGQGYRGKKDVTLSGKTCQKWSSHDTTKRGWSPKLLEKNYCRNPSDADGGPWCYSTDPDKITEYCLNKCQGSFFHGSKLKVRKDYSASSVYKSYWWGTTYPAKLAVTGSYWCSKKEARLPVYWWMSLSEPVEIISIAFEEKYEGATFEFFASHVKKATNEFVRKPLIKGTRDEINDVDFENGESYRYYGLVITAFGKGKKYASLKNFQFYAKGAHKNAYVACWEPCGSKGGSCSFCGGGSCCRQGWPGGDGCTGTNGCNGNHCCVQGQVVEEKMQD